MENSEGNRLSLQYASKTQPPPRAKPSPLEPRVRKSLWRQFLFGIGLLLVPLVHAVLVSGMLGLMAFHESVGIVAMIMGGFGPILLLVLSFRLIHKRRVVNGILCLFLFMGSLVYLLFCGLGIYNAFRPINTLTAPDGKQYVLLCRASLFDHYYEMGTLKHDFGILKTYDKLAYGVPYFGTYSRFTLIRPEPMAKQTEFRFFVQNNLICLQEEDGYLVMLFDLKTQKQIDPDHETVSHWILLDEQSEVHQADETILIDDLSHTFDDHPEIMPDLNHPNPNVRESAKRVMRALNIPEPTTRPARKP